MDLQKWGREKARARYGSEGMKKMADGGEVRPLPINPVKLRPGVQEYNENKSRWEDVGKNDKSTSTGGPRGLGK